MSLATLGRWLKSRQVVLLLLLIIALGSFLRIYGLGGQSIQPDEANSAMVASQNLASVATGDAAGNHPPLYFIILHFWIGLFGSSEIVLRAPSVIFGILSVWHNPPREADEFVEIEAVEGRYGGGRTCARG